MAVNELIRFASANNANVTPFDQWLASNVPENGFVSGIAKSADANRAWAQGALAGYVMGQLIVDQLNKDAKIESGTFFEDFKLALSKFVPTSIADGSLVFSKIDPDALATIDEAIAATTNDKLLTPLLAKKEFLALADLIVPVGSFMFMDAEPDEDYFIPGYGGAYSRTKYNRLFKKWGVKYGAGDGSTTFNVPNIIGRVLQGAASMQDVGKYLEAQLPNITGSIKDVHVGNIPRGGGCVQWIDNGGLEPRSLAGAWSFGDYLIDSSKSNATYSGDKLQVSALQLLACIRC